MQKRSIALAISAAVVAAGGIVFGLQMSGGASASHATATPDDVVFVPEVSSDRNLPTLDVSVTQGTHAAALRVLPAATESERERGLMWITSMPQDQGMLFLFPTDGEVGFWMENTYIPLDIAFIADDGTLLGVAQGEPLSTKILEPPAPYRYVIETNVGWWQSHGFSAGAHVHLPSGLPAAS